MPDVEFDKETNILEAGTTERERIHEGDTDQTPFPTAGADHLQNEEEFFCTRNDERC
jgi:hypothetical protein